MLAVTLGNNCLWRESLARTACVSIGVCKRDRDGERVGGMCVYFLPGVSGDVCVCVCVCVCVDG